MGRRPRRHLPDRRHPPAVVPDRQGHDQPLSRTRPPGVRCGRSDGAGRGDRRAQRPRRAQLHDPAAANADRPPTGVPGRRGPGHVPGLRRPARRRPIPARPPVCRTPRATRLAGAQRVDLADSPAWVGGGADVLRASQDQGLEGVVAKRLASTYQPGARGRDWIKTKNIRIQEVVIGGWSPGQGRREGRIGSLLLGIPDPPGTPQTAAELAAGRGLRYIGNVGTGFTHQLLTDLARRLAPLAQHTSPFTAGAPVPREQARFAHWVAPVIVGEVAYGEFTPDGILRHPAWRGYRPDKRPVDVRQE